MLLVFLGVLRINGKIYINDLDACKSIVSETSNVWQPSHKGSYKKLSGHHLRDLKINKDHLVATIVLRSVILKQKYFITWSTDRPTDLPTDAKHYAFYFITNLGKIRHLFSLSHRGSISVCSYLNFKMDVN